MNVRELIDLLSDEIDPETVVTILDARSDVDRHIHPPLEVEQFTVRLVPGDAVTEEDLA